jgi:hypothetical protein
VTPMRPLRAVPRAILVIVPTALIAGAFGFFLGHQSALSQAPGHRTPAHSTQTQTQTSNAGAWTATFACRSGGRALCDTLATNAYRIVDPRGAVLELGTIESIAHRSVTVQFPSTPTDTWQIEVTAPGSCNGCDGSVAPRAWGPFKAGQTPPTSLVVSR